MNDEELAWRKDAACRGMDPILWHATTEIDLAELDMWARRGLTVRMSDGTHSREGKRICAACPVRLECALWAVETRQQDGIWGGLGAEGKLKWLRSVAGSKPEVLERRIVKEQDALRVEFGLLVEEQRSWQPKRRCKRCDDWVPAGRHPPDRNPEGATCGRVSTAVKGCQCFRCGIVNTKRQIEDRARK